MDILALIRHWLVAILTAAVCVKAYTFDSEAQTSGISCDSGEDYQADYSDCTRFWRCANGKPFKFQCPAGLHFNVKLSVCDWPESAACGSGSSGSGSSYSGSSSGSDYGSSYAQDSKDSQKEDYDYGDEPHLESYPYQPSGTAVPKYYEEEKYYTEAPRGAKAPVYRPVSGGHSSSSSDQSGSISGHSSGNYGGQSGGNSGGNYGGQSGSNSGHSSGNYGGQSGSNSGNYGGKSGGSSGNYGGQSSGNYGSGTKVYGRGTSGSKGSSSSKSFGSGYGSSSGNNNNNNNNNDNSDNDNYNQGHGSSQGRQDYPESKDYGGSNQDFNPPDYEYDSKKEYDSGKEYDGPGFYSHGTGGSGGNKGVYRPQNGGNYGSGSSHGGGSNHGSGSGGSYGSGIGGYYGSGGYYGGSDTSQGSGSYYGSGQGSGGYYGGGGNYYGSGSGHGSGGYYGGGGSSGGYGNKYGSGAGNNYGTGSNYGSGSKYGSGSGSYGTGSSYYGPGSSYYPSGYGSQPVPWMHAQPPANFQAGVNAGIQQKQQPYYPPPQPPYPQPHHPHYPPPLPPFPQPHPHPHPPPMRPMQGSGATVLTGTLTVGGGGGSSGGGSMHLAPITLGKPNVGVSGLGQAFIPVIQKSPELSSKFSTGSGYLQFNPVGGGGATMDDFGMLLGNSGMHGDDRHMMVGEMINHHGGGSMMDYDNGMMMQPSMQHMSLGSGTGSGGYHGSGLGTAGLGSVLIPVQFVNDASTSTAATSTSTAATGTSTAATASTSPSTINGTALAPININIFLPPFFPFPSVPEVIVPPRARSLTSSSAEASTNAGHVSLPRVFPADSTGQFAGMASSLQSLNGFDVSQLSPDPNAESRCTARRSSQRISVPVVQQSGNALSQRKCSALGELINSFVFVYIENLPSQPDGSCVIQVPDIQVTCNAVPQLRSQVGLQQSANVETNLNPPNFGNNAPFGG